MFGYALKRIVGTKNDRVLKSLRPLVARVNELEPTYQKMSDADLKHQTEVFKERIANGESSDSIRPEAFAVVREAAVRTLKMRHFDVQIIGGAVLDDGKIAEMKTGEGKTLVATLAAYLNALFDKGVHIVTVNDYLAKRDAEWMGQVYNFLGLSVGVVWSGQSDDEKLDAYRSSITYGQNNEFGFDYLRDNMKFSINEIYQRQHFFGIVDEVDSILIDEARTPLIISGPGEDPSETYQSINKYIPRLKEGEHFEMDLKTKQPALNEDGVAYVEELLGVDNLYDPKNTELLHHVSQSLKAHTSFERDVDYVVKDGQVIIVDEFTGRLMPGRRWSDGLHQAIEAKEGLRIARENQTLASITFQNYFRMYEKLAGMTGTADTEAVEFKKIYNLDVVVIPTNKPMIRDDQTDCVFRTRNEKYEAVTEDIEEARQIGQPVLVGTISIEQSETLAKLLQSKGIPHNVLNAKHHEREAEIVAQAGRVGAVTISTNMAGRGTDIVLGGNPQYLAVAEAGTKDTEDPKYRAAFERFAAECAEGRKQVLESGGLFIMGTERHESRRIDNQLRGRSGRQGDPGKSRFYISLEDDLMKRFGGERLQGLMNKFGWEEGVAIDGRLISKSIESAQERVERYHFEARKHVTEYDDVMNKQRQVVYNLRYKVLGGEEVRDEIFEMLDDLVEDAIVSACPDNTKPIEWDMDALRERLTFLFEDEKLLPTDIELQQQVIFDHLREALRDKYAAHAALVTEKLRHIEQLTDSAGNPIHVNISRAGDKPFDFRTVEEDTILETLDHYWNLHLQEMDHLREGIGWRGVGQKNPLHEYQREGFILFQNMLASMKEATLRRLFLYQVPDPQELLAHIQAEQARRAALARQMRMVHGQEGEDGEARPKRDPKDPKTQRAKIDQQRKARRRKRK